MTDPYPYGARRVAYRFDILRDGGTLGQLQAVDAPSIEMVYDGEVKLSLSGSFLPHGRFDHLTDTIRPQMRIGEVWYPLGEYLPISLHTNYGPTGAVMEIQAYDRAVILQQATATRRVMYAKGNRYLDVIQAILIENGIQRIVVDRDAGDRLQADREDWELGTPYLTIINQLLSEINYRSLWFDAQGQARLSPYVPPNKAPVLHVYEANACSLLYADWTLANETANAYNVFLKIVSSPDYPFPLRARAVNDDPASPLSTVRRGREITDPDTRLDNISSQQALQEYVNNVRDKSKLSASTVTWQTVNVPIHGVRDVVALKNRYIDALMMEIRWTMTLSHDGSMTHEGRVITI